MDRFRAWISRFSSGSASANTVKTQDTNKTRRESRADLVVELQANISRLQQEILALSNAESSPPDGGAGDGSNPQMAALERQLEKAQRELAKYQGRV